MDELTITNEVTGKSELNDTDKRLLINNTFDTSIPDSISGRDTHITVFGW